MPTKVVVCDTPDGLAQLQYVLIKSGAALEIETVDRRPAGRRGLGAGVGLHLARQLVVRHGGILWADPLPSGGTRVSFVIPVHEGDQVGRPEGLGSDPLDDLHSLSETHP